ncbi:MAG: hypothetical protein AB7V32_02040 [Candidatus Berkiella sp.]
MTSSFDPAPLEAFFEEVKEQLGIVLKYHSDNPKFPIQLASAPDGLAKNKCIELLQFIKTQVDLRDNEIGEIYASKTIPGKYVFDIRMPAAKALADVYALSTFYPHEDDEDEPLRQPKKTKKHDEDSASKSQKIPSKKSSNNDEDE